MLMVPLKSLYSWFFEVFMFFLIFFIRYDSPLEIIDDFAIIREQFYIKRKEYELSMLQKQLDLLRNRRKFCSQVIHKKLDLFGKSKEQISQELVAQNFAPLSLHDHSSPSFDYLLQTSMDAFSKERILALEKDYESKNDKLNQLSKLSVQDTWLNEINAIKQHHLIEVTQ